MAVVRVVTEKRIGGPMVDMGMFAHRPVLFTNLAGLLLGLAMSPTPPSDRAHLPLSRLSRAPRAVRPGSGRPDCRTAYVRCEMLRLAPEYGHGTRRIHGENAV
ncbi:hypothetical protein [Streptomyces sp. NPDC047028]|uniref:hypothetical protein n=1 Tax=Streptomyces sp. NPDC047028 TaxID=3155793 RepID=UPI0033C7446F